MIVREGYKVTELGEIPNEWKVVNIESVAKRYSGHTPDKKIEGYWNGNIPWISLKDTRKLDKRYIKETEDYTNINGIKKSSAVLLPKGTVVLSRDATIGKIGITETEMATSQHFINYVCTDNLDNLYLYYDFFYRKQMFESIGAGSTIKTIGLGFFKSLKIVLPPIGEQRKIAEILSQVDDKIDQTDQLIVKTKELKKGLMQRLLTKGIGYTRLKKTEIGEMPEAWNTHKVREITSLITNGFVGTASPYYAKENGIPYLMSNNIRCNRIDERTLVKVTKEFAEQYPKSQVLFGDMLTVQSGHIGTSCSVPEKYDGVNCHALIISRFNKSIAESNFIAEYLNSEIGMKRLSSIFVGTTVKHINVKDFKNFLLPIPPLSEQQKIADVLSSVDEQITHHELRKTSLEKLKQGLMQQLLTGKIRVIA